FQVVKFHFRALAIATVFRDGVDVACLAQHAPGIVVAAGVAYDDVVAEGLAPVAVHDQLAVARAHRAARPWAAVADAGRGLYAEDELAMRVELAGKHLEEAPPVDFGRRTARCLDER